MCDRMKNHPFAGVVGFKWKLVPELFNYSGVNDAFRFIADARTKPAIKVIRSRRNALDVHISKYKHEVAIANNEEKLSAHCKKGEQKCQEEHLNSSSGLELPTQDLLKTLRQHIMKEDEVDNYLVSMNIPHVSVSYEKLYSGDKTAVDEWKRLFAFLGRGPFNDLTFEQLESAIATEVTHYPWHNQSLANYDEVREALVGTELEWLMH